jgi:hypothetical protein
MNLKECLWLMTFLALVKKGDVLEIIREAHQIIVQLIIIVID